MKTNKRFRHFSFCLVAIVLGTVACRFSSPNTEGGNKAVFTAIKEALKADDDTVNDSLLLVALHLAEKNRHISTDTLASR